MKKWGRRICHGVLEGVQGKRLSAKIAYYLKNYHGARVEKEFQNCQKEGGCVEGLSLRQMLLPAPFKKLKKKDIGFQFPWCGDAIPSGIKGSLLKKSKRFQRMDCEKRPKRMTTLWQFHSMGLGRTNGSKLKYRVIPAKGGSSFAKRGHKIDKVKMNNWRHGGVQTTCLCSLCNGAMPLLCLKAFLGQV